MNPKWCFPRKIGPRSVAREVPERDGRPVVGVDLANGRAWASAVAWYGNGRTEALAVCPGIPRHC